MKIAGFGWLPDLPDHRDYTPDEEEAPDTLDALGTLTSGEHKTIRRNGQPMGMNNDADTITLLDPAGSVVQSVSYTGTVEGHPIIPQ